MPGGKGFNPLRDLFAKGENTVATRARRKLAIQKTIYDAEITLDFLLDPCAADWNESALVGAGGTETYSADDYVLTLTQRNGDGYTTVMFNLQRKDGTSFTVRQYRVRAQFPIRDLHKIWIPYYLYDTEFVGIRRNIPPALDHVSDRRASALTMADRGIPAVFMMNRAGSVKIAMGLLDQRIETSYTVDMVATNPRSIPKGNARIEFVRPTEGYVLGPTERFSDGFYVARGAFWFDAMQRYRQVYDEMAHRSIQPSPDPAWEPLWATFSAAPLGGDDDHSTRTSDIDEELMLKEAAIAASLGIGTVILEPDTWFANTDRYWLETVFNRWCWPDQCGDYVPNARRMPHFAEMIKSFRGMGLRSILWVSPFVAGERTRLREKMRDYLIEVESGGTEGWSAETRHGDHFLTSYLCPRVQDVQEHGAALVQRLLRDYGVDGFKVDMLETFSPSPCLALHRHDYSSLGMAVADGIARLKRAIDEVKPDAIVEFRQSYSNIHNINYANGHRAVDSAEMGDFDWDRRLCVQLRSYIPPGVAVYNDPAWWRQDESETNIAKILSTQVISGVPELVTDLVNMSEEHRSLVKKWISFYHEHKQDFRHGTLYPLQNDPWFSTVRVESGDKTFISYANYPVTRAPLKNTLPRELYLFNCTNRDSLYTILENIGGEYKGEAYDHGFNPTGWVRAEARSNELVLDVNVEQGGLVKLRRVGF